MLHTMLFLQVLSHFNWSYSMLAVTANKNT